MAHIDNIGASIYTRIDYVPGNISTADRATPANLAGKFEATAAADGSAATTEAAVVAIEGIREFPSLGTPSNIVNVPQYGQSISSQIQGQADAPSLEFTFNYIPTNHAALDTLLKLAQTSYSVFVFQTQKTVVYKIHLLPTLLPSMKTSISKALSLLSRSFLP
jgi:hypothetical protein